MNFFRKKPTPPSGGPVPSEDNKKEVDMSDTNLDLSMQGLLKDLEAEFSDSEVNKITQEIDDNRRKMLLLLESDLDAAGWDKPSLLYGVRVGDDGEEYFTLIHQFEGHPADEMMEMAVNGDFAATTVALVVATEFWSYPKKITDTLKTEKAMRAMWAACPPHDHPDRIDGRSLTMLDRTGAYIALSRTRDTEPEFAKDVSGNVLNSLRLLLGLNESFNAGRDAARSLMQLIMDTVHSGTKVTYEQFVPMVMRTLRPYYTAQHSEPSEDGLKKHAEGVIGEMPPMIREELGF